MEVQRAKSKGQREEVKKSEVRGQEVRNQYSYEDLISYECGGASKAII